MKYYKIADLNLAIDGVDFEYFNSRMKDYQVGKTDKYDISVNFELNNSIVRNTPHPFVTKNGRSYFKGMSRNING